jgi:phage shock protein C
MSARRTRFYRDKRNGRFLGVCAGLADYFGIDVTLVRIGVVLLTLAGGFPWTVFAYFVTAWIADDKPREFDDMDTDEKRFWQGVRARPRATVRDVRSRFRDLDRRLADIETHYTSSESRLAREIDALRDPN